MFSMQCRKKIIVEDNKKRMNTQNKNDSINSILHHGHVVEKNCCVVFPASGFPYLILCPRQYKWKGATTYLAIRIKNN